MFSECFKVVLSGLHSVLVTSPRSALLQVLKARGIIADTSALGKALATVQGLMAMVETLATDPANLQPDGFHTNVLLSRIGPPLPRPCVGF